MMYECAQCENMTRLPGCESNATTRQCPVCEEATTWQVAFEGEGLSF